MGRGTHRTRPPRLPLQAEEAADIEAMMKQALATRPRLPDVGLRHAA
jgi:4-hydroxy-tetrahydrodipicolinate synthase